MSAHFSAVYGQTPPVENLGSLASFLVCRCLTSFRRRFFLVHRLLIFRLVTFTLLVMQGNKNPCLPSSKQG
jgi:hypothetical protein